MKPIHFILLGLYMAFTSCHNGGMSNNLFDTTYRDTLIKTKEHYPFANWRKAYDNGMTQYSEQNCDKAKEIFDALISGLTVLGRNASEDLKVQQFKIAILKTNDLNDDTDGTLIETGEREDLVELTNKITIACGLDPSKYGNGEGLASEWRDW